LLSAYAAGNRPAVPLPSRRHGLIPGSRSSRSGRDSDESWKHDRIVNAGPRSEVRLQK
jgi:hypothetical protein